MRGLFPHQAGHEESMEISGFWLWETIQLLKMWTFEEAPKGAKHSKKGEIAHPVKAIRAQRGSCKNASKGILI